MTDETIKKLSDPQYFTDAHNKELQQHLDNCGNDVAAVQDFLNNLGIGKPDYVEGYAGTGKAPVITEEDLDNGNFMVDSYTPETGWDTEHWTPSKEDS